MNIGGGFIIWSQDPRRKEFVKSSNENLKKELNEILMKSRENDQIFCENCHYVTNYYPPIKNQNNISENELLPPYYLKNHKNLNSDLDDTIKYDSDNDNLEDTLDYNDEGHNNKKQKFDEILEKEEGIAKIWAKALDHLENNELDEAYSTILNSGDDIYLIRLMMKTGSCLKKLRRKTAVLLLKRLAMIGKSNFLQKMCLNFLDDFKNKDATESLKIEDQKKILDVLENIQRKKGPLQQQSSHLHDYFIKKFK